MLAFIHLYVSPIVQICVSSTVKKIWLSGLEALRLDHSVVYFVQITLFELLKYWAVTVFCPTVWM